MESSDCTIYAFRHFEKGTEGQMGVGPDGEGRPLLEDMLTVEGRYQAFLAGRAFKAAGIVFAAAFSSARVRCLESMTGMLLGVGTPMPVWTERELSSLAEDPEFGPDARKALKARAKSLGCDSEELFLTAPEYAAHVVRRGKKAAACVERIAAANMGKTVLLSSHSGGVLEPMIEQLPSANDTRFTMGGRRFRLGGFAVIKHDGLHVASVDLAAV